MVCLEESMQRWEEMADSISDYLRSVRNVGEMVKAYQNSVSAVALPSLTFNPCFDSINKICELMERIEEGWPQNLITHVNEQISRESLQVHVWT